MDKMPEQWIDVHDCENGQNRQRQNWRLQDVPSGDKAIPMEQTDEGPLSQRSLGEGLVNTGSGLVRAVENEHDGECWQAHVVSPRN
jgi:hypothetical protein